MNIDGQDVTRSEFEYIYNKNNSLATDSKALKEYVALFVNFKLKVNAALSIGIDTTSAFKEELSGYRRQLAKSYLSDDKAKEAEALNFYNNMKVRTLPVNVQVMHIFKYIPQNTSALRLQKVQLQMDSLYEALSKDGTIDFVKMVEAYSDDKNSFWAGFLQTPTEFEDVVFSMNVGEISKPFFTPQGIHIVKVLNRKELPPFESVKHDIMSRLTRRNGIDKGTESVVERLKQSYNFSFNKSALDQLLSKGETDDVLFYIDNIAYSGAQFKQFAQSYPRAIRQQLDGFVAKSILAYEDSRLEEKYPEFRLLMQEYKDGMLLFEVSNAEVWEKAASDEVGLKNYFAQNTSKYHWDTPRFRGIVVHAQDKKTAKQVRRMLKQMAGESYGDTLTTIFNRGGNEKIQIEQGIFEKGQNAFVDHHTFKGKIPHLVDGYPYTVVFGEKLFGPSSYNEIRGMVAADYQNYLDTLWIKQLRSNAKVEINQEVLKTVNNH